VLIPPPSPQIAQTIQLAVAPVFLLVAAGGLLNVITGRLARVVDRSRDLMQQYADTKGKEHDRLVVELRGLDQRIDVINNSILLCVASGIVVCVLVSMLFIQELLHRPLGYAVSAAFVVAMLLLLAALVLFLVEVRLAIRNIHVPLELLELEEQGRKAFTFRARKSRAPGGNDL
jgi:hypothetical protein